MQSREGPSADPGLFPSRRGSGVPSPDLRTVPELGTHPPPSRRKRGGQTGDVQAKRIRRQSKPAFVTDSGRSGWIQSTPGCQVYGQIVPSDVPLPTRVQKR